MDRADGGEGKKRHYYVMRPSPLISGVNGAWLLGQKSRRNREDDLLELQTGIIGTFDRIVFAAAKRRLLPLTNRAAVKDHKLLLPQERELAEKREESAEEF